MRIKRLFWVLTSFGVVALACVPPQAFASVGKDHLSNFALWDGPGEGIFDNFLDPHDDWSAVVGISFLGTGEEVAKVGVLWVKSSVDGTPNGGSAAELEWRVAFFEAASSFSMSAVRLQAQWAKTFPAPTNAGWENTLGGVDVLGWEVRGAEFDVSELRIPTSPGQLHIIGVAPRSKIAEPQTIAGTVASLGGQGAIGGTADWYHCGAELGGPFGPGLLPGPNWNFEYVAAIVILHHPMDSDADSDVDLSDFAKFQACFNGPNRPYACS